MSDRPNMRFYPLHVIRRESVSPHLVRVTLSGESAKRFPFAGADARVKLLLPLPGQQEPFLDGVDGIPGVLALPDAVRPIMRTYTIRHHRTDVGELDIDFVLHDEMIGPASQWAARAQPGDAVTLYGPAASYAPAADAGWQLIAGDESALPAMAAIVDGLPQGVMARVFAEVDDPGDQLDWSHADAEVTWLFRMGAPAHSSPLLPDALRAYSLPSGPGYAWLAAESGVVTSLRRHLVNERGIDAKRVTFTGYWRHGRAENDPD